MEFMLQGFSIIRHDYGRGILIAVRDRPGLTWKTLDCTDFEPGDYLIQGVSVGDDRLRDAVSVYNVYASHCSAVDDWRFLEQIENLPGPSLVLGDFNARSPAWCASGLHNSNGKALEELLSDSGLQLLTSPTPTRLADRPGDSDTTIDLAFSAGDVPGDVFWAPTYHGASDHLLETARSARNKADAVWKRITLSSKRRCWDVFLQESYRDSGQFWRFIGSMGDSKPQTSSMQMVAGSRILRTDEEKGSAFLQRFVDQCSRGDMSRRDEAIRDLSSRLPQLAPSELFGMDDLTRAIERIGQVSPGPDRIPASALKNLSAQSKSRLLSEINESLVSGIVPTEWCDSVLVPVPKPGKDHHRLEGHRIIAVQNLLGKVAESMVCERLASHLEPRMPPGMGAYRKGRSTWTNAGVVTHVISEAFERREQAVLVALDLQDAYNMVSLPKLAHRLLVLDTDVRLTRWIMAALRSRRCSMKCGRWMSDWTDVPTALPQGSPLSPICFNAYLQPIASIITPDNAILLCYADDITIVAWHRDISSAIGTAQEVVNNVKAACDHLDMVINPQKASVTVFGKRRPTQPLEAVVYGGEPISYSDQVKLLGVTLDPALTFNAHADSVRSRCVRALSTLKAAYSRGVDLRRISHLYRSLVLSRITYGLEIINPLKTTMDKLERIQNSALRLATGCPRQTPVTALRYMFDLPSIVDLHEVLRARAVCIVASDCGHPLHDFVDQALARAPLARLQRTGWLRDGTKALRGLCGRHKIRRSHLWSATPPATRCRWTFKIDLFSRTDRELPPHVVNAMFEEVLADTSSELPQPLVVLATDGSVTTSTPRSGWGCVMRESDGSLQTHRGGCNLRLSSMRAELEAIFRGLDLARSAHPDLAACIICTDSQSLLRKLESGSAPPEWHDLPQQVVWVYCPGHAGVQLNDRADHLAGSGSASDYLELGTQDIQLIIRDRQLSSRDDGSWEERRMSERGLQRGWAAKSTSRGRAAHTMCQLATGTLSRAALTRVFQLGGAEAAWGQLLGLRRLTTLPLDQ
ncbi:uncharacterized protein LOC122366724 [Amphibalanus amphitrite]|nr:uncharacterized protein LOC122366724 [Amphibalanus amphitrite]